MTYLAAVSSLLVLGCVATSEPAPGDDPSAGGKADGTVSFVVNGHTLNAREQQWLRYVADRVIPDLPGTQARKLEIASRVSWWSLKEGIFDTSNAPRYSNCNTSSGDRLLGPLDTCGTGRAWQVGLSAVQVPNHTLDELETLAQQLYPGEAIEDVLAEAAGEAGFAAGSDTANQIAAATGSLRKSWLLRRSAIGFVACERNEVVPECIDGSLGWCYGTGWDTTRLYAPNKTAALRSIRDLATILGALSGGTSTATPWVGASCDADSDCSFTSGGATGFCFIPDGRSSGFCSLACEGYCPDKAGYPTTFCVAKATGGGMCAVKAIGDSCASVPGTEPFDMDRYIGSSSAPPATATVCGY